jgi:hypothetical protein
MDLDLDWGAGSRDLAAPKMGRLSLTTARKYVQHADLWHLFALGDEEEESV